MTAPGKAAEREAAAFDAAARGRLLATARAAIAAHLSGRPAEPQATAPDAASSGVFVSLHRVRDGELRGCVGQLDAHEPLQELVAQMAVAAATRDGRFEPVSASELDGLRIEISVLSALHPIRPDEVEVGRHGLLVRQGSARGVLLPQVPVAHGWDRETFLAQTCVKAGLPWDAWKGADAELRGFTATVFGEEPERGGPGGGDGDLREGS